MRIAHVVFSLKVGGQERLILNLSRALMERGHEVMVVCLSEGGALRREFGPIRIIDTIRSGGFEPTLFARLARVFASERPDVVHTHNPGPLIYAAPAARAVLVRRVVHTKHGANAVYTRRSLAMARVASRLLTAFVPVSAETAQVARKLERVPDRLLHVIPNGIPLSEFGKSAASRARVRGELGIPTGAFVVGTVGRLVVEKDYPLLVRAVAPMLDEQTRLVIVGEGPARDDIEREIAASVPEASRRFVTLTGVRQDVPAVLASFDVFALSSQTEGLPLVVPEAMASTLPVVPTAVGGLPGIVPREVGLLVPHGDADALASAIDELRRDDLKRRRLGESAHAYAHQRFSLEQMTTEYERLYRS
jgi:glycosyltransferase involved in cell wall biosynthesis